MTSLRKLARGEQCLVRAPGVCNFDPSTVILAHYRSVSLGAGMGIKSPDLAAALCCSGCHDLVDGRTRSDEFTKAEIRLMLAEGCLRTILHWADIGVLRIGQKEKAHG